MDQKPKVFFTPVADGEAPETLAEKAIALYRKAEFEKQIESGCLVAIKQHFGEKGNLGHLRPPIAKAFVGVMKDLGARPFLTDTTTLYSGQRRNAVDYLNLCQEHGFSHDFLGCPVIIADGLTGASHVKVPVNGKHYDEVAIASAAYHAHAIVVLTHVTSHPESGLAASIKNVAMGLTNRAAKMSQHSGLTPKVDAAACTACGRCAKWCSVEAITIEETVVIDSEVCIGCGQCLAVCPSDALGFEWGSTPQDIQEKMAEHCLGVTQTHPGRMCYFNFMTNITKGCDCFGTKQSSDYPDIGIAASLDPVALDQASVDILEQQLGKDIFEEMRPGLTYTHQLEHGEKIGLGRRDFQLINADL
ncbi:MAG: DUF362 domain-containing protein [Phycisphaerae bacterium]|jgi:hypothetical protein|nr:DUF362 domain-containing protein [Phycisphaerae bacterium]